MSVESDGSIIFRWYVNGKLCKVADGVPQVSANQDGITVDAAIAASVPALSPCITLADGAGVFWCIANGPLFPLPDFQAGTKSAHSPVLLAPTTEAFRVLMVANVCRAAGKGHTATVAALLESTGVAINEADEMQMTPLMHAAAGGHSETFIFLAEKGADFDLEDLHGKTALMLADASNTAFWSGIIRSDMPCGANGGTALLPGRGAT
jgi:hypothetical protein